MKQIFLSRKGVSLEEVPEPVLDDRMMIVRNIYSCISPGTETAGLKSMKMNLFKKIYQKPKILKSMINTFNKTGLGNTKNLIKKKLGQFYEIGYSSAGIIEKVGKDVRFFSPGDYVACVGGGFASHAEKILMPENLVVRVKNSKKLNFYSSVALGAISLQSLRRLKPCLGDICLVVGLGLIGQITLQLLRANGVNVYGIDPSEIALKKAKKEGFKNTYMSFSDLKNNIPYDLKKNGFDGVIITASSQAKNIIDESFYVCRRKAKVVLVGDVNPSFNREIAYQKEIDFYLLYL